VAIIFKVCSSIHQISTFNLFQKASSTYTKVFSVHHIQIVYDFIVLSFNNFKASDGFNHLFASQSVTIIITFSLSLFLSSNKLLPISIASPKAVHCKFELT
jgi:hypothetical protein